MPEIGITHLHPRSAQAPRLRFSARLINKTSELDLSLVSRRRPLSRATYLRKLTVCAKKSSSWLSKSSFERSSNVLGKWTGAQQPSFHRGFIVVGCYDVERIAEVV